MQINNLFVFALIFLFTTPWALGSAGLVAVGVINVEAITRNPPAEKAMFIVSYEIAVVNRGSRDLTIPTRGYVNRNSSDKKKTFVVLSWERLRDRSGEFLVSPREEYFFVTLRPGERALLSWRSVEFDLERLSDVDLELKIDERFGARYSCFNGDIPVVSLRAILNGEVLWSKL